MRFFAPISVLPGDMCSVKFSNAKLDNFLCPGDVIHKIKLLVAFMCPQTQKPFLSKSLTFF